jgi:2,3-bisphosphoglycerate-independent phosphoglycerate mutase
VPVILVEGERRKLPGHGTDVQLRNHGGLADIAPTILDILGIAKPALMTGNSLIVPATADLIQERIPQSIGA